MSFLGILRLDTQFPRLPGDAGHPATWQALQIPVRFHVVAGATPSRVVRQADPALLAPFVEAARALVAEGASALTTSCGFLVRWQAELQAAVPVPVWTSSLLLLPTMPRPGVLTVDAASLGPAELAAAVGAHEPGAGATATTERLAGTPVEGLEPGCTLQRTLLEDLPVLDALQAEADTVAAARRLVARHPGIEALVLECTNLPPYAGAVQRATGRPVHHLMTLVQERWKATR